MASYPDIIKDPYTPNPLPRTVISRIPLRVSYETRTLISRFEPEGQEKRRQKWTVPRRRISIDYAFMLQHEIRLITQFWLDHNGAFQPFTFFFPNQDIYWEEFVGVTEGGETHLRLPSRGATAYLLHQNGQLTYSWAMDAYSGPDGEDMAQLASYAGAGDRWTFSFTGRLAVHCRFESDIQDIEYIKTHGSGTVVLQGLVHNPTSY